MQGWFKNRKKIGECNQKTFDPATDSKRIRFGDSSDACEEGYYQFTHIYECKNGGAGWDSSSKSCKFTPKVQVLDNWGWCNSLDGNGKWNDNETDPKKYKDRNCYWDKIEPWTEFNGTIEVTP